MEGHYNEGLCSMGPGTLDCWSSIGSPSFVGSVSKSICLFFRGTTTSATLNRCLGHDQCNMVCPF